VLGWLIRGGRCPKCKTGITYVYPTVEAFVGVVSAFLPLMLSEWSLKTLSFVFVFWVCIILSWIDIRNRVIPEFGTWLLLFTGLVFSPFEPDPLIRSVGAAVCALCFWMALTIVGLLKGEDTHAGGDVALAAAAGAWIGMSVSAAPVFMLATSLLFIAHAVVAQKINGDRWFPMGPAISGGLLVTMASMIL
jgi:prepilin signal peptidase PulO-like enzyme (type II secretory pathway)